jgi:hypothetical protein
MQGFEPTISVFERCNTVRALECAATVTGCGAVFPSIILCECQLIRWLDDRGSRVRFPAEAGNFSHHHYVQNGSGARPASYPMGARGSFPGGKEVGA